MALLKIMPEPLFTLWQYGQGHHRFLQKAVEIERDKSEPEPRKGISVMITGPRLIAMLPQKGGVESNLKVTVAEKGTDYLTLDSEAIIWIQE